MPGLFSFTISPQLHHWMQDWESDYQQFLLTNSLQPFIILQLGRDGVVAMRVLILKPERDAELITKGLGNLGHDFLFAPTAEAARKMLRENDVDLIIAPSGLSVHTVLTRDSRVSTIPFCETPALSA